MPPSYLYKSMGWPYAEGSWCCTSSHLGGCIVDELADASDEAFWTVGYFDHTAVFHSHNSYASCLNPEHILLNLMNAMSPHSRRDQSFYPFYSFDWDDFLFHFIGRDDPIFNGAICLPEQAIEISKYIRSKK